MKNEVNEKHITDELKKENEGEVNSCQNIAEAVNETEINHAEEENSSKASKNSDNLLQDSKLDFNDESNHNKKKNRIDKKNKKKITGMIAPSLFVVLGICVGVYFGRMYFEPKFDPSKVNVSELVEKTNEEYYNDYQKLLKKYNNDLTTVDLSSTEKLTPSDIVNIAFAKFASYEYSYTVSFGKVNAAGMVNSTIRNAFVKRENNFMNESLSKGNGPLGSFATKAKRFYQYQDGSVKIYTGSKIQTESAEYSEDKIDKEVNNVELLRNAIGRDYSCPTAYIISNKTCLSSSLQLNAEQYIIDLDLDPSLAATKYVYQMDYISGVGFPTFSMINLSFILKKDLTILKVITNEKYKAMGQNTVGFLEEYFHPGIEKNILDINENFNYEGELTK